MFLIRTIKNRIMLLFVVEFQESSKEYFIFWNHLDWHADAINYDHLKVSRKN